MSNVVNAAFGVIRSARGAGGPPEPGVKIVKSIIKGPFVSPWRHPIWWWKMRHLRADIRVLDQVNPDVTSRMREVEDDAFLNGSGR